MKLRNLAVIGGLSVALVAAGAVGAQASSLIGSRGILNNSVRSIDIHDGTVRGVDIKNGTITRADINDVTEAKLKGQAGANGVDGKNGSDGKDGADGTDGKNGSDGKDGKDGVSGLYYVTAHYGTEVGDKPWVSVNEGAIATVACLDPADHAVAGGVQTLGLDGGVPAAVASSFPGRMNWDTNAPKPNRFDGWIVQFDARNAPVKADVWVTCAKDTTIAQYEVGIS